MSRLFYGWRIVAVCLVAGVFANALGLFGAGVYLHELVVMRGWPTGLVSGAITTFYVTSALLLIPVGTLIGRYGGRASIVTGAMALPAGIALIGRVQAPWQAYAVFFVMGIGWSCLSMTAVATTLAPWFERHQGRAVSMASLGARPVARCLRWLSRAVAARGRGGCHRGQRGADVAPISRAPRRPSPLARAARSGRTWPLSGG